MKGQAAGIAPLRAQAMPACGMVMVRLRLMPCSRA